MVIGFHEAKIKEAFRYLFLEMNNISSRKCCFSFIIRKIFHSVLFQTSELTETLKKASFN